MSLYNNISNNNIFNNAGTNIYSNVIKEVIVPEEVRDIGGRAFYSCSSLKDVYVDNHQSNIWFGNNWNTYAYVHYSNCTHTITKNIESGLQIQEVSNNLTNESIKCGETYQFKVLNEQGDVVTNKKVKVISQGQFTNSSDVT